MSWRIEQAYAQGLFELGLYFPNHSNFALPDLLAKRLEHSGLLLKGEIFSPPGPAGWHTAVAHALTLKLAVDANRPDSDHCGLTAALVIQAFLIGSLSRNRLVDSSLRTQ